MKRPNEQGPAGVAVISVGTDLATNTVGEVSAKRKLSAVAIGTKCLVPNVLVDGWSNHRVDRGSLSVKSAPVSGRSSQVSSSHRPRKRVTFADDTRVSV